MFNDKLITLQLPACELPWCTESEQEIMSAQEFKINVLIPENKVRAKDPEYIAQEQRWVDAWNEKYSKGV